MITDRLRITVIECNTNLVLARDVVCKQVVPTKKLSGPSYLTLAVPFQESTLSASGIKWKRWGQWIVCEIEIDGQREIFSAGVITNRKIDPQTGDMNLEVQGPTFYPHGIPWLQDYQDIAASPVTVIEKVWSHLQSFGNAGLNVIVNSDQSLKDLQMLPGYSYVDSHLNFNFFGIFVRAVDMQDCGDYIDALARDIPFDFYERPAWNENRTQIVNNVDLVHTYPDPSDPDNIIGLRIQKHLAFRLGENVIEAELADDTDNKFATDVIVRSWQPGRVMSATLNVNDANGLSEPNDPAYLRRVVMEEDINLESNERAAAWAQRKLTRRFIPDYFSKITVDPDHPNAPYGRFDVGDQILVEATYPWVGELSVWHRIISIKYDEEKRQMELDLMVAGAFNYDPINYQPEYGQALPPTTLVPNGYFENGMEHWTLAKGQWFRSTTITYQPNSEKINSVRVDCDDSGEQLVSDRFVVTPGTRMTTECRVCWQNIDSSPTDAFQLVAVPWVGEVVQPSIVIAEFKHPQGTQGWQQLSNRNFVIPAGITTMAIMLNVTSGVKGAPYYPEDVPNGTNSWDYTGTRRLGTSWWTYVRINEYETQVVIPDKPWET